MANDPLNSDQKTRLIRLLGASMVCIAGRFVFLDAEGNPIGQEQVFSATAFAMLFDGKPVLITAGHVIDELLDPMFKENAYEGHNVKILECKICDFFGPDAKTHFRTPLDYSTVRCFSIDREAKRKNSLGLDFGMIFLNDFYWQSLCANGVKPIEEEHWALDASRPYDVLKLVGFPENTELAKHGMSQLVVVSVSATTDPDVPLYDGQPAWKVGIMPSEIDSVKGMSGGPIFGFWKVGENTWQYQLVAVQSWQNKDEKTLYATPIASFAPLIRQLLRKVPPAPDS